MKTLTAAAEQARQRSWVAVRYRLTLTLWRDRYGAAPVSFTTRWSDRDELTPAVVRPRPVEDRWLRAGPGLGPDWLVPATGGPWDAFRIARRGQIQLGDRTRRALVRYAPWIPPGNQRATVTLPAGCSLLGAAEAGVALRLTNAADGYLVTAGTGADVDLSPTVGLRILVAGALTGAVWQRDDIVWEPEDRLTAEVLDLTGGDRLITVRRNHVVLGQYRDTSLPVPFTGGGLGLTAVSPGGSEGLPLGPFVGGAIPAPPATTAVAWQGLVLAWDGIEDALAPTNPAISIGHLALQLDNTRPVDGTPGGPVARVSDLFRIGTNTGGYDVGTSEALLEVAFEGQDPATEAVRLFRLMLDDVEDVTEDTVVLNCSGVELAYEDWDTLLRITTDRFPDCAPESVGQIIPLLCGDLHRARAWFVQAGIIDRLRVEVPSSQFQPFWLQLSEPERVRRLPGSGQLQIGEEVMTYDQTRPYGTAEEIATVHVTQRAQRNTVAVTHRAGAEVWALSSSGQTSEYVAVLGQNRPGLSTQAWSQVYADGMAKDAASPPAHTIELANTTLWPPHSLVVARFAPTAVGGDILRAVEWGVASHAYQTPPPTAWQTYMLVPAFGFWETKPNSHFQCLFVGHEGYPEFQTTYSALIRFSLVAGPVPSPPPVWFECASMEMWPWSWWRYGDCILEELIWDSALSLEAATAPVRRNLGIIPAMTQAALGDFHHQVDVAASVNDALAAGRPFLVFRIRLENLAHSAYGNSDNAGPHVIPVRPEPGYEPPGYAP
jgi:hypothetical protein